MGHPDNTRTDHLAPLRLDPEQLREIRESLARRIGAGLQEEKSQVRALPAWLPRPRQGLAGEALVLDTGGTNMRAARVRIQPDGSHQVEAGPVEAPVPTGRDGPAVTAADFFAAQVALLSRLAPRPGLPLGYCFSYPAEVTPEADARLIRWTKGVEILGVEGNLVGRPLAQAMEQAAFAPSGFRVLNDTVAAMLAGAGQHAGRFDDFIGLIAGTGTNMAGFFKTAQIPKLPRGGWPHDEMAVNLESGNFHPPHLSLWDEELDQALDHPGHQRFEKAISGHYLPYLFQRITAQVGFEPEKGSAQLVAMRGARGPGLTAEALLTRSARLVAAGLAGLIQTSGQRARVGIVAEGSLFWGDPEFRPEVEKTLADLVPPGVHFEILHVPDANLVGSAFAALS